MRASKKSIINLVRKAFDPVCFFVNVTLLSRNFLISVDHTTTWKGDYFEEA
jgi:hypothetical protein